MMGQQTLTESEICSRGLFVSGDNRSYINGRLKLRGNRRVQKKQLCRWYDQYMKQMRIENKYIENPITWQEFMTENYIRQYTGVNPVYSEDIPYVPWDTNNCKQKNNNLIRQSRADGKFPKFHIESAIEDKRDKCGNIVIRNAHTTNRMYLPARPWRFKENVPQYQKTFGANGSKLIDREQRGTLYDYELLGRAHTPRDMSIFYSNDNGHAGDNWVPHQTGIGSDSAGPLSGMHNKSRRQQ